MSGSFYHSRFSVSYSPDCSSDFSAIACIYLSCMTSFSRLEFCCAASTAFKNCEIQSALVKSVFINWGISTASTVWSPEKFWEMVKEFKGRDFRIKHIRVIELLVTYLVHDSHDEVLAGCVCRFVERTVIYPGLMFSFGLVNFCYCCVPVNCVIV